jgi:chromosome segregation ATPase
VHAQDEQLNNDELQLKLANTELKASDLEQELTALRQTHNVTLTHLEAATERMEAMEAEMGRAIATTQEASAAREAELGTQIAKLQARVNNDGKQRHRDTAAQLRTELNSRYDQTSGLVRCCETTHF